jgi:hypothetical protein
MGGRENTTTRFRRYPRTEDGSAVTHISLADRDEQQEYLIHTHTIQLVVYKDVVQYIVDGRVFYEIRKGILAGYGHRERDELSGYGHD